MQFVRVQAEAVNRGQSSCIWVPLGVVNISFNPWES